MCFLNTAIPPALSFCLFLIPLVVIASGLDVIFAEEMVAASRTASYSTITLMLEGCVKNHSEGNIDHSYQECI